jgi:hypothetical protein
VHVVWKRDLKQFQQKGQQLNKATTQLQNLKPHLKHLPGVLGKKVQRKLVHFEIFHQLLGRSTAPLTTAKTLDAAANQRNS